MTIMDKQDKVENGSYLFSQPTTFDKAFPSIKTLQIKVMIRKGGPMDGAPQTQYFSIQNPPGEYIRCVNSGCTDGGWRIGNVLRDMVEKKETSKTVTGICSGRERMNRSSFRKCLTQFSAEIKLSYD